MKLIALKEVYYASKTRKPGDEFECDPGHANILKGIGSAKDAEPAKTGPKPAATIAPRKIMTKVETPIDLGPPDGDPIPPRRRYMRRDLTPEE